MARYQVEEIYGDTVVSSGVVVEDDPMKAAEAAAGQRMSPRALQEHWFRVVDEEQAAVYEYSLAAHEEHPDPFEGKDRSDLGRRSTVRCRGHSRTSTTISNYLLKVTDQLAGRVRTCPNADPLSLSPLLRPISNAQTLCWCCRGVLVARAHFDQRATEARISRHSTLCRCSRQVNDLLNGQAHSDSTRSGSRVGRMEPDRRGISRPAG